MLLYLAQVMTSSENESNYDTDSKAKILAHDNKMFRKKQKEDILDVFWYTFDVEGLPEWVGCQGGKKT